MKKYEYKIVPAPVVPGGSWFGWKKDDGFTNTVTDMLNELGNCGWSYVRSETLTLRKRRWYGRSNYIRHEVLVFRRVTADSVAAEDRARIMLTEDRDIAKVTPRRVRDVEAVARVRAGARRIEHGETSIEGPRLAAAN